MPISRWRRRSAGILKIPLGKINLTKFSDGELYCQILENVRGKDVFIIQPTCSPVNSNLMELLIMIDAFKRSSATRITSVIPYYGYGRQDRKDKPRVPISSKLVADLLTAAGTDRILSMDLHAGQIQGFFDIPVDHLYAAPVLIEYLKKLKIPDLTMVSPDAGGVERARAFARRLDADLAIIDKRRTAPNEAEVLHIIGQVSGRNIVIMRRHDRYRRHAGEYSLARCAKKKAEQDFRLRNARDIERSGDRETAERADRRDHPYQYGTAGQIQDVAEYDHFERCRLAGHRHTQHSRRNECQ